MASSPSSSNTNETGNPLLQSSSVSAIELHEEKELEIFFQSSTLPDIPPTIPTETVPLTETGIRSVAQYYDFQGIIQVASRHIKLEPLKSKNLPWHVSWIQALLSLNRIKEAQKHIRDHFSNLQFQDYVDNYYKMTKSKSNQPSSLNLANDPSSDSSSSSQTTVCPYSLYVLEAQVYLLSDNLYEGLEKMYQIYTYTKEITQQRKNHDDYFFWKFRQLKLAFLLITTHFENHEYAVCLNLAKNLLLEYPQHPSLCSLIGRIHLQYGNLVSARSYFEAVGTSARKLWVDAVSSKSIQAYVHVTLIMHQGYIYACAGNMQKAGEVFEKAQTFVDTYLSETAHDLTSDYLTPSLASHSLSFDPSVVLNNQAVCKLYQYDYPVALELLNSAVRRNPVKALLCKYIPFNIATLHRISHDSAGRKLFYLLNRIYLHQ